MFADFENSQQDGRPVELYEFSLGATVWRYNDQEGSYTYSGQPYVYRNIKRGRPASAVQEKRHELLVELPSDDPVASRFIGIVPAEPMLLTITRLHRDDPDQEGLIIWKARVLGASYSESGALAKLRTVTYESAFSRPIPRYKFQGQCNHVLYDARCAVDKDLHKFEGTVSGVVGTTITVPGLEAAEGSGWAVPGYVEFGTDFRIVIAPDGDDLTLLLNFENSVVGEDVIVYAGCDHWIKGDCLNKFNNTINHGGFPFVSTRNPFVSGLD
jgi:uncharacterized phage protein (TIGR02218 family)